MTILLAVAHRDFVFIASDTRRTDLLKPWLQLSASKMRVSNFSGFVMGGANVDRTKFADSLIQARAAGESFIEAANRLAPALFSEKKPRLLELSESRRSQVVFSVYAEAAGRECSAQIHQIGDPESFALSFAGSFVNIPSLHKRNQEITSDLVAMDGRFELDSWAKSLAAVAAQDKSLGVGFPCDLALLRPNQISVVRKDVTADTPPDPAFVTSMSPSELIFRPGGIINFPSITAD